MSTAAKKQRLAERLDKHGRQLLAIFPNATEQDPVKLCSHLRRLEKMAHDAALNLCNVPNYQERAEKIFDSVSRAVTQLLNNGEHTNTPNVWINDDPRGYALKISGEYLRTFNLQLHTDMGGDGILSPEFTGDV